MDFFEAQASARRRTARLVVLYIVAVILIIASVYAAAVLILFFAGGQERPPVRLWQPEVFAATAIGVITLVAAGSLFKTASLKSGGGAVARMLGGRRIDSDTPRASERRLVNVVEEMAIAAGVRIPEIYVLPEEGINAFAAGFSTDDAAIAVTRGCLEALSRDQLQGVIAHEFSHILNGDMRLNIRLIGLLFGILLLAVTGQVLLRSTGRAALLGGRRRDNKSGGIIIVILLAGFALILIGYIGVFFGRMIQSAVSRQREFLADASAVQFTRNPDAIAGALKQIGAHSSALTTSHATEASHLFFANALRRSFQGLFATHPPLTDRIHAIDPSFDGDYSKVKPRARRTRAEKPAQSDKKSATALDRDTFITRVGTLAGITLASTASALEAIPQKIRHLAHSPESARTLVLALLLDADSEIRGRQIDAVERHFGIPISRKAQQVVRLARGFDRQQRLTLLDLALPALKRLEPDARSTFHQAVDELIVANNEVSLFEFAVQQLLRRYVPVKPDTGRRRIADFHAITPLAADIALVLATLAASTQGEASTEAYRAGANRIDEVSLLPIPDVSGIHVEKIAGALEHLSRASLPICKRILDACTQTAGFDGTIDASEAELLRAISATLDCPIPPLGTPS